MRHVLLSVIVLALALGSLSIAEAADREVTVTPIEYATPTPLTFGPENYLQACQVGNLNDPAWAIANFMLPPEDYKLAFDPMATCTVCPMGVRILTVRVMLQTAAACQIVMSVDVEEAVYPTPGCPAPGPVWCASAPYQVDIPAAGLWNIGIPISCDCITMNQKYLLSVHFESATCTPDLITDAGPAALCTNWNNYGTGWYDLVSSYPTWPGQLKIFADAECCSPPVPVEDKTWGAVKELYKD